jgi:hypothetical protein
VYDELERMMKEETWVRFQALPDFPRRSGILEKGPLSLVRLIEELFEIKKIAASVKKTEVNGRRHPLR